MLLAGELGIFKVVSNATHFCILLPSSSTYDAKVGDVDQSGAHCAIQIVVSVKAFQRQKASKWAMSLMPKGVNSSNALYTLPDADPEQFSFHLFPPFTVYKREGFAVRVDVLEGGAVFGKEFKFRYPEGDAVIVDW